MFKEFLDNATTRKVALFGGIVASLAAGLVYAVISDLKLMNSSLWLFLSIICAFGSCICLAISDLIKSNKVAFYIVRGIGIALGIGFIIVMILYPSLYTTIRKSDKEVRDIYMTLKEDKSYTTAQINSLIKLAQIPSIIIMAVGILFHAFGLTQNIVCGIDE